jgi:hypothetical protein
MEKPILARWVFSLSIYKKAYIWYKEIININASRQTIRVETGVSKLESGD